MMIESRVPQASRWAGRNVLVLSPTPTHPTDFGNRRRIYHVCRRLQDLGAAIVFVHYPGEFDWRETVPLRAQSQMVNQWDHYYVVPPTRSLHTVPAGPHHLADEWWDPAIGDMLAWIFRTHPIDILIVNYTWLSKALTYAPANVVKILDTHDKFSGRRELLESWGIRPEFFYMTQDQEKLALDRADIVWAIKTQEETEFRAMTRKTVLTLLHAEPVRAQPYTRRPSILRFGLFGARNSINHQNFRCFLGECHNFLRKTLLPCEIVIAGTCCEELEDIELPFVRKLGRVEEPQAFYNNVDVVLGAIAFSTGLKIKIGEALSFGKAVISHAHCFEGYVATHPFHALPSFQDMLRACRAVVRDPQMIDSLEAASRQTLFAADQSVSKALEMTLAPETSIAGSVVLVVAAEDVHAESWVFGHVCEAAEYIAFQLRVCFLITNSDTPPEQAAINRLQHFGPVFADHGGGCQHFKLQALTLEQLLAGGARGIWFATLPNKIPRNTGGCTPVGWISLAVAMVNRRDADVFRKLRKLRRLFSDFTVSDVEPSRLLSHVSNMAQTYLMPVFWSGHTNGTIARITKSERRMITFFVSAEGERFLPDILAVVAANTRIPVEYVLASVPLDENIAAFPAVTYGEMLARRNVAPMLVIEIGESSAFAGVREMIRRAGVPWRRLFASGGSTLQDLALDHLVESDPAASLLLLHELLSEDWRIRELWRTTRRQETYLTDAGWTFVWDKVKQLAELHALAAPPPVSEVPPSDRL